MVSLRVRGGKGLHCGRLQEATPARVGTRVRRNLLGDGVMNENCNEALHEAVIPVQYRCAHRIDQGPPVKGNQIGTTSCSVTSTGNAKSYEKTGT